MYLRFGNNTSNVWEIKQDNGSKIIAIYRGRIVNTPEPIQDIIHDERRYRLWKMFNDNSKGYDHMSDTYPLLYYMFSKGYEKIEKIRDSKYIFHSFNN